MTELNGASNFRIEKFVAPGEHLTGLAASQGVPPESLMRDYAAWLRMGNIITVAVGDMANSFAGDTHQDAAIALELGLPSDSKLNGGLIGSVVLRREMANHTETGVPLVQAANDILADTYRKYGIGHDGVVKPADRFTGYLTHAVIGPERTTLTGVGDVYAWVNGVHVLGYEKSVDTAKDHLVNELEATLTLDPVARTGCIAKMVKDFGRIGQFGEPLTDTLYGRLTESIRNAEKPDRQTVYRPVDVTVTTYQIDEFQNRPKDSHPLAYGAVDGSETPKEYIEIYTIPTDTINTLVIATDGSKPRSPGAAVLDFSDLVPVNPEFAEQTIVRITRVI